MKGERICESESLCHLRNWLLCSLKAPPHESPRPFSAHSIGAAVKVTFQSDSMLAVALWYPAHLSKPVPFRRHRWWNWVIVSPSPEALEGILATPPPTSQVPGCHHVLLQRKKEQVLCGCLQGRNRSRSIELTQCRAASSGEPLIQGLCFFPSVGMSCYSLCLLVLQGRCHLKVAGLQWRAGFWPPSVAWCWTLQKVSHLLILPASLLPLENEWMNNLMENYPSTCLLQGSLFYLCAQVKDVWLPGCENVRVPKHAHCSTPWMALDLWTDWTKLYYNIGF